LPRKPDRVPDHNEDHSIKQIGALPYRSEPDGSLRILLITSRNTGRWIIPKGNPIGGLLPHEAAAQEAFEEAGASGRTDPRSIGAFTYIKLCKDGQHRSADVDVYPLAVTDMAREWPEQYERDKRWFDPAEAADAVDEDGLKRLIHIFRETQQSSGTCARS
jgi:8-oxo-dGTP pyrophosphatase MutT (NUDIX family)